MVRFNNHTKHERHIKKRNKTHENERKRKKRRVTKEKTGNDVVEGYGTVVKCSNQEISFRHL